MLNENKQLGGTMSRNRTPGRLQQNAQPRGPFAHPGVPFPRPISRPLKDMAGFEFPTSQVPPQTYGTPNTSMQGPIQSPRASDSNETVLSSTQPCFSFQDQLTMSNHEEPLER